MEKKDVAVRVRPLDHEATDSDIELVEHPIETPYRKATERNAWKSFPWPGFVGLAVALVCAIASFLVLLLSNEQPATFWLDGRLAPNVILTLLNNISILAIALAFSQGFAINWWRRALSGATVQELHYSWLFTNYTTSIFRRIKYFNVIALAVLMTKIAMFDGVLYQKATSVEDRLLEGRNWTFPVFGAKVFPTTGTMGLTRDTNGFFSDAWKTVMLDFEKTGLKVDEGVRIERCTGEWCDYTLEGAGFAVDCTQTTTTTIDYGESAPQAFAHNITKGYDKLPLFNVSFARSWPSAIKNYSALTLSTVFADTSNPYNNSQFTNASCPLGLTVRTCELRPALVRYMVQYINPWSETLSEQRYPDKKKDKPTTIKTSPKDRLKSGTLLHYNCTIENGTDYSVCARYDPGARQLSGLKVIRDLDIFEPFKAGAESTLESFYLTMQKLLSGQASLTYSNNTNKLWYVTTTGLPPIRHSRTNNVQNSCAYQYEDPLTEVLQMVNVMAFMAVQRESLYYDETTASLASPYSAADVGTQDVEAQVYLVDVHYKSNRVYMFAALAVSIAVILCVASLFWGYWELERRVSMGPLEIANAFMGPLFDEVKGECADEVLEHLGPQKLMYGLLEGGGKRMGFKVA